MKERITSEVQISVAEMAIVLNGSALEDEQTVADAKLTAGAALHVLRKTRAVL